MADKIIDSPKSSATVDKKFTEHFLFTPRFHLAPEPGPSDNSETKPEPPVVVVAPPETTMAAADMKTSKSSPKAADQQGTSALHTDVVRVSG